MSLTTISLTADINGITPATVQRAGVQGSHNVTALAFTLSNALKTALAAEKDAHEDSSLQYRFDGHSGSGMIASTEPETLTLAEETVLT